MAGICFDSPCSGSGIATWPKISKHKIADHFRRNAREPSSREKDYLMTSLKK
jgi:hypothetical protein